LHGGRHGPLFNQRSIRKKKPLKLIKRKLRRSERDEQLAAEKPGRHAEIVPREGAHFVLSRALKGPGMTPCQSRSSPQRDRRAMASFYDQAAEAAKAEAAK